MLCGVIKLNKRGRQLLALIVALINLIQISIGMCLSIVGMFTIQNVGTKLFSECAEIAFVYSVIAMYGVNVVFQYIMGLIICHKCYKKPDKKTTGRLLCVWSMSACNTVLNGIVFAVLSSKVGKHILKSMKYALKRGMEEYLTDLTWKIAIDTLQQNSHCCGIKDARDWIESDWVSTKFSNYTKFKTFQKKEEALSIKMSSIPWSCCKIGYTLPCIHDQYQQPNYLIPDRSTHSIGCLQILTHPIEISLRIIIFANTTLLFLQILTLVLIRILYTASKNATLLRQCSELRSPGWVCGPDKRRYNETLRKLIQNEYLERNNKKVFKDKCSDCESLIADEKYSYVNSRSCRFGFKRNKNGTILIVGSDETLCERSFSSS